MLQRVSMVIAIIIILVRCANPTLSDVDEDSVEEPDFLAEIVLVEDQTSVFTYQDELFLVEFVETGGGVTDVIIKKGDDEVETSLTSRQPEKHFGLWWMTTWVSSLDGLAGLIVSDEEPDKDHVGPPVPGEIVDPDDAVDPHPHSFYEKGENQSDSGRVEPYDYSYGPRPSPGDTITLTVKLNASSSGTHLFRVAFGGNSNIKEVEVPAGNSVHELQLEVPSDMDSGWQMMRFTTMTDDGDIIYNNPEDYWIRIQ